MDLNKAEKFVHFRGRYHSGLLSGLASAHAATAGFFWLANHVDGGELIAVRRVLFASPRPAAQSTAITRVSVERVTFTGTPTGTQGTVAAYDSAHALPSSVSVRTASTGLTLAAGGVITSAVMAQTLEATPTGVGSDMEPKPIFDDGGDLNAAVLLRPGEGIVCRQPDNGDTDQRATVDVLFWTFALDS